jgi:hypothetical protein
MIIFYRLYCMYRFHGYTITAAARKAWRML